jgi:hypothetical protein
LNFTVVGTLPSGEYTEQTVTVEFVHNMAAPYFENADLPLSDLELTVK